MNESKDVAMGPEEFTAEVRAILRTYEDDPEVSHARLDKLMETVLTQLGYGEGVKLISNSDRWYA